MNVYLQDIVVQFIVNIILFTFFSIFYNFYNLFFVLVSLLSRALADPSSVNTTLILNILNCVSLTSIMKKKF